MAEGGFETGYRAWVKKLVPALGFSAATPTFTATYYCTPVLGAKQDRSIAHPEFFPTVIRQNTLLTAQNYEPRARLIGFDVDVHVQNQVFGREVEITDHIEIMPVNPVAVVNRALTRLNLNGDDIVEITPLAGAPKKYFSFHKLAQRMILEQIVDLSGIPSRSILENMAPLAKDVADREAILTLARDCSETSEYKKLVGGVFSLLDALEKFPSVDISLGQLMTIAPIIAARQYSIASDHSKGKHARFEILCGVPVRDGGKHTGLCAGMLDRVLPGDSINIRFIESIAKLPKDSNNVLYIAFGTGVGQTRSALQRRQLAKMSGKNVGSAHLFYGFRHQGKDCLFTDEFEAMKREGVLSTTYVASSDGATFISPIGSINSTVVEFLGKTGEIVFCGPGGSVPGLVEAALKKAGVDTVALRGSGRYHEEYFTADWAAEKLMQ